MKRIPEPELMLNEEQVRAYAAGDFSKPHNRFVQLLSDFYPEIEGYVLDLGCGAADVSIRFARAFPRCIVHGLDGSPAMLKFGNRAISREHLDDRVELLCRCLPVEELPVSKYDAVISNSLLHHLKNPQILWQTVEHVANLGAPVFVMDLIRPQSEDQARKLIQTYAAYEPEVLQQDFYNSLVAAYRLNEVRAQLQQAEMNRLQVRSVSDRHFIVYGRL